MGYKQYIVVRGDLKMGKGKLAAQVAHASVSAMLVAPRDDRQKWLDEGQKKIVVKVSSEDELLTLFKKAREMEIPAFLVEDAGYTQLPPKTRTSLGLGPADEDKLEELAGNLKLL